MKVHAMWIAVIALAIVGPLSATPVAARSKDPDSFLVTSTPHGGCTFGTSFGDPPRTGRCPAGLPALTTSQTVSRRSAEADTPARTAVSAVTHAGARHYPSVIPPPTTGIRGGSRTAGSTSVSHYPMPDNLRDTLSKGATP